MRIRLRDERREERWLRKQVLADMSPAERRVFRQETRKQRRRAKEEALERLAHAERVRRERRILLRRCGIFLALVGLYLAFAFFIRGKYEPKTEKTETNRDPAVYSSETLLKCAMSVQFPELTSKIRETYVVPGLRETKTIQGEFHASSMCTQMTPQGMCVTEDELLISAYCHTGRHNSVIYLIDKKSGELLKTVPLGSKAHVGGLAYDAVNQIVWVSGGSTGAAKAIGYSLKDLRDYDEYSRTAVSAVFNYTLATMIRNSYMAYADSSLIVGLFKTSGLSQISWYQQTEDGGLDAHIFADYDAYHESVVPDFTAVTSGEVQGASQTMSEASSESETAGRLILSKSYGIFDSSLQIHAYEDGKINYRDADAEQILRFPQKMEQVCEYDGKLYCLFESAAYCYRLQPALLIDRVLVFDMEDLIG